MPNQGAIASEAAVSQVAEAVAGLFPLRLTPFEYYYLLEDRRDYPAVFHIRLECRGTLDREAFARAFQLAHTRHPLLSARLERDRSGWPIWVAGRPEPIHWDYDPGASSEEFHGSHISARLRANVIQDGDRSVLSFVFHHVAVDGMGGFLFIADLMLAYAHYSLGEPGPPKLRALETPLLRERNEHTLSRRGIRPIDLVRLPRVTLPLLFQRVALFGRRDKRAPESCDESLASEYLIHTLSEQETALLSHVAQKLEVRLHELLLRDYFLMLAAWNQNSDEARRPMRVLVPTNLRRREHFRMPAANVFGYTFLTRRSRDCGDRSRLLLSIRSEMAAIKSGRRALYHEAGLRLSCVWPRFLKWSLERKGPFATAVFTNLNAGFDRVPLPGREGRRVAGELIVENGYGAGPIRPDTRVSLAVHNYAGRMSIALRSDHKVFGPHEQNAILQAYLEQLRTTMDSCS